jgi:hypothetical protein
VRFVAPSLPTLVARLVHAAGESLAVLALEPLVVPRAQRRNKDTVGRRRAVVFCGRLWEQLLVADSAQELVQDLLRRLLLLEHPDLDADEAAAPVRLAP